LRKFHLARTQLNRQQRFGAFRNFCHRSFCLGICLAML
jgi:hypothetical protein